MRKMLCIGLVSVALTLSGCQDLGMKTNEAKQHTTYNPTGGKSSILKTEHYLDHDPKVADFGYIQHQKAQVMAQNREPIAGYFDRNILADYISKMSLYVPGVNEVGTLVTHKHVLISYEADTDNPEETAEQIRKSAEYLVPRYYEIYVSDKPEMMENIERFSTMSTLTPNVDETIEYTISEMLGTNPYIAKPRGNATESNIRYEQ